MSQLQTYGFSEFHYRNRKGDLLVLRTLGGNYHRLYLNRELVMQFYDQKTFDFLIDKHISEMGFYDLFFMCSEGAEETTCSCWKEGLE